MFTPFYNEEFKEFFLEHAARKRYAVSNYGRLISFKNKFKDGTLVKGGLVEGYKVLQFKYIRKKKMVCKNYYVHYLVAQLFIPKKREDQDLVIHLDFSRNNNVVSNLKWVNKAERLAHNKKSPAVILAKEKFIEHNRTKKKGLKLTESKVRILKKKIFDPARKTRLKIIAQQFGISEMQLYRIKSGENWGHVKI